VMKRIDANNLTSVDRESARSVRGGHVFFENENDLSFAVLFSPMRFLVSAG